MLSNKKMNSLAVIHCANNSEHTSRDHIKEIKINASEINKKLKENSKEIYKNFYFKEYTPS